MSCFPSFRPPSARVTRYAPTTFGVGGSAESDEKADKAIADSHASEYVGAVVTKTLGPVAGVIAAKVTTFALTTFIHATGVDLSGGSCTGPALPLWLADVPHYKTLGIKDIETVAGRAKELHDAFIKEKFFDAQGNQIGCGTLLLVFPVKAQVGDGTACKKDPDCAYVINGQIRPDIEATHLHWPSVDEAILSWAYLRAFAEKKAAEKKKAQAATSGGALTTVALLGAAAVGTWFLLKR